MTEHDEDMKEEDQPRKIFSLDLLILVKSAQN